MTTQTHRSAVRGSSIALLAASAAPFGFSHRPRFVFEAEGLGSGETTGESENKDPTGIAASQAAAAAAAEADAKKDEGKDDKTKPTDEEARLLREVMKNKDDLKNTKTALEAAQANLARFEGIDPDAVRALLKEKEDAQTAELEAKGEWSRIKENMVSAHKTELQAKDATIAELEQKVTAANREIDELTLGHQFTGSEFIKSKMSVGPQSVRALFGQHFERKDGTIVAYDKPAGASDRTPLTDASGNTLGFDAAMQTLVDKHVERDHLLRSQVKQGSGGGADQRHDKPSNDKNEGLTGKNAMAAALARAAQRK